MLAEIFMLRLEAERRRVQQSLPSSASRFTLFGPRSQFGFKEAKHKAAEALTEEPRLRVVL
jgi:hypothetical protein